MSQARSPRNECHLSLAATLSPHVRSYELALDEGELEVPQERAYVWNLGATR